MGSQSCNKSVDVHREIRVPDPEGLMRKYKTTGDIELRNKLVMHYLRHVNAAIFGMRNILLSNIPYEDFFNQGVIALIECIERYDPDRGASFDTFSYLAIRGSVLKYLRKQNWLPNRLWEARKNISHGKRKLEFELMREPTNLELAEYLGISEQQLSRDLIEMSVIDTVSFEELVETSYLNRMEDVKASDNEIDEEVVSRVIRKELCGALGDAINTLPIKQRQIITLYYYENLTLREIGKIFDLSPQRITQIRKKALENVEKVMRNSGFDTSYQE